MGYAPIREENIAHFDSVLKSELPKPLNTYAIKVFSGKNTDKKSIALAQKKGLLYAPQHSIEELIPNYYRSDIKLDKERQASKKFQKWQHSSPANVQNISKPYNLTEGLENKHLALWNSHGWYYENELDRWEWQRARVFQTVEDLYPTEFILTYLVPMLENAGANTYLPRERDWQTQMYIVDNDTKSGYAEKGNITDGGRGFGIGKLPYESGVNPFELGTYRQMQTSTQKTSEISWTPKVEKTGEYAVYIAYESLKNSTENAHYTVKHSGGETEFSVNQKMGGGTWIYLGKFHFEEGSHADNASVVLSNESTRKGEIVTADAIRFGGGMGDVSRNDKTSGRPRFLEAARYYLQFAGAPAQSVYNTNADTLDYVDDYKSRGKWVNYLLGEPYFKAEETEEDTEGLNIPIDLSFAFHTDAGVTRNDTVVGTLMIYSETGIDKNIQFPDKSKRIASRDLTDIIQTEIVSDIRTQYDSAWTRRSMWDKRYSEAVTPNVPSTLLELLSHQNFLDMKFGLDPQFQFDVSRSIYKGIVRFLAYQHNTEFAIQPLPIQQFSIELQANNDALLTWQPTSDPLEPSAEAKSYVVYKKEEGKGFDNGTLVHDNQMLFTDLKEGVIYSFKVNALNEGGESMPSEILSVCNMNNGKSPVLIVNGFDRVAPPATIEKDSTLLLFDNRIDAGVPYRYNLSFIGEQYDYDPSSAWLDDDAPGHGASYSNYETQVIAGNTFDYPYLHGKAIRAAGYSFSSCSKKSIEEGRIQLEKYKVVDLILGEQKTTKAQRDYHASEFEVFSEALQKQLSTYLAEGRSLFVSGAYLGTDLFEGKDKNHNDVLFGKNVLGIFGRTNYASKAGKTHTAIKGFESFDNIAYTTELNDSIYAVEAPDGIEPINTHGVQFLRYSDSNIGAGVFVNAPQKKVIALGFPFETIQTDRKKAEVMKAVLELLMSESLSN